MKKNYNFLKYIFIVNLLIINFKVLGEFSIDKYDSSKAYVGTTIFAYNWNKKNPRIVEVNMDGDIVWEYKIPKKLLKKRPYMLMDVERLTNGNTLFNVRNSGIYEINNSGSIVWQHLDIDSSHDVDRLENGNTIYVRAWVDQGKAHVIEVDPSGNTVWQWDGLSEFNTAPYSDIERGGWMHVNAVTRLESGETLISLRNLQMIIKVSPEGRIVWKQTFNCDRAEDKWSLGHEDSIEGCNAHEPEIDSNGTMLVAVRNPDVVYQLDLSTGKILWEWWGDTSERIRDVDRLPNGNILIQDNNKLTEVTPDKKVVWILKANNLPWSKEDIGSGKALYKAQRTGF
jgi:outer membrane protein assembly factor BamB